MGAHGLPAAGTAHARDVAAVAGRAEQQTQVGTCHIQEGECEGVPGPSFPKLIMKHLISPSVLIAT